MSEVNIKLYINDILPLTAVHSRACIMRNLTSMISNSISCTSSTYKTQNQSSLPGQMLKHQTKNTVYSVQRFSTPVRELWFLDITGLFDHIDAFFCLKFAAFIFSHYMVYFLTLVSTTKHRLFLAQILKDTYNITLTAILFRW